LVGDTELELLLARFKLSFEGYRKVRKGVKKRLRRKIQELGLRRFREFLAALDSNPDLEAEVRLLLTVSISRFFRDLEVWRIIEEEILPGLGGPGLIRAWSAGCGRGEEAYTLRMVHRRLQRFRPELPPLSLLATDLNPAFLAQAEEGIYPRSSLREVPEELKEEFFRPLRGQRRYPVREGLKEGITWREHDLLSGRPPGRFDLVLLRNNVLTYCRRELKERALATVEAALEPGGFLVIGAKERLEPRPGGWEPFQGRSDIFTYRP